MKIWVVVDVDNGWAINAFHGENAEERASDFADEYYFKTGFDCRYDEIYLLEAKKMVLYKIVWHWFDEDGYIREKTIFFTDNMDTVIKEWRQRVRLATYGWYDIVKEEI